MTAMILKLANSAFFSLRQTVSSPGEAISILGIDLLKSLTLAHGLFTQAGAFPLNAGSADSALITSLGPGSESTPTVPKTWRLASQT